MYFYNGLQQKVSAFFQNPTCIAINLMARKSVKFSIPPETISVCPLFDMSSQITRLNLDFFLGHRCCDNLFPESGLKAGTILV